MRLSILVVEEDRLAHETPTCRLFTIVALNSMEFDHRFGKVLFPSARVFFFFSFFFFLSFFSSVLLLFAFQKTLFLAPVSPVPAYVRACGGGRGEGGSGAPLSWRRTQNAGVKATKNKRLRDIRLPVHVHDTNKTARHNGQKDCGLEALCPTSALLWRTYLLALNSPPSSPPFFAECLTNQPELYPFVAPR